MASFLGFSWNFNQSVQTNQTLMDLPSASSHETETMDPQSQHVKEPTTPEGLRPRKTSAQLRREMPSFLGRSLHDNSNRSNSNRSNSNYNGNIRSVDFGETDRIIPILPRQRTTIGLTDESMESQEHFHDSPQSSTHSSYSRRSIESQFVAESPELKVGYARTAVGEVLAMVDEQSRKQPPSFAPANPPHINNSMQLHSSMAVLPPRDWIREDIDQMHDDFTASDNDDLPYHPLNESLLTPTRKRKDIMEDSGSSSGESSFHASPSSFRREKEQYQQTSWLDPDDEKNRSGISRTWLKQGSIRSGSYDFDSILDKEIEPCEHEDANMSGISHLTKDFDNAAMGHAHATEHDAYQLTQGGFAEGEEEVMDNMLCNRKKVNQRRAKEEMLFSAIECLRDNVDMVCSVADELSASGVKELQMPHEETSFFSGISDLMREQLRKRISTAQMEISQQGQSDLTLDLMSALNFCADLLRTTPGNEDNQLAPSAYLQKGHAWKCVPGFRSCIGLNEPPSTPEPVRGGDTSLFSLPSNSTNTPHTSNVSLATTITSAYTGSKHEGRSLLKQQDGIQLRRTLEMVTAFFIKLNEACLRLAEIQRGSMLQITQEIKATYLQLIAIKTTNLKALVDGFELSLPPLQITRMVSEDCDEHAPITFNQDIHRFGNTQMHPSAHSRTSSITHQISPGGQYDSDDDEGMDEQEALDTFSPTTLDMDSTAMDNKDCAEDLRRTVGSFDGADGPVRSQRENDVRRDQPPTIASQNQAQIKRRRKQGRWMRRPAFRKLTTSE